MRGLRGNDDVTELPTRSNITLGILAGGRATRLGGLDKAWLQRRGVHQVVHWQRRFSDEVGAILVSANRDLERYVLAGMEPVPDRSMNDAGPIAGLDALATACLTQWLLTIPVDLVGVNECLLPSLVAATASDGAGADGAYAVDDDGVQPLVALWRVASLRNALGAAAAAGEAAVHALQSRLVMARVRFEGVRFGNLNTPADLLAAGFSRE